MTRAPVSWRVVEPSLVTAGVAHARARELLDAAADGDPPAAVWSVVRETALVLGRGSRVQADAAACRRAGIAVVRRESGGGPVLWTPDLMGLDLIVPKGHRLWSDDVVDSYRWVGEVAGRAFRSLGLAARALRPDEARAANDRGLAELACFAGRSPWEVVVGDRKVVGLSQTRRRHATLIQAGIAFAHPGARLASLLDLAPERRHELVAALERPAVELDPPAMTPSHEHVVEAVHAALAEHEGAAAASIAGA